MWNARPLPGNLVGKDEIEKWVENGLPRIKTWLKERQSTIERVRFEFFSATEFHPDAKELIEKIEATHRKQSVRFYSGHEVVKRL